LTALDLVERLEEVGQAQDGGVALSCATRRLRPEVRDWYGTDAETVYHPPERGAAARLRLDLVADGVLRLRFAGAGAPLPCGPSEMLVDPAGAPPPAALADGVLQGGGLRVELVPEPFAVRVHDDAGRLRFATRPLDVPELEAGQRPEWRWLFLNRHAYPLGTDGRRAHLAWQLGHDERLFGLGEGFGPLDRRFAEHDLWVQEAFSNATPASYKQVPFVWSTAGWGLFAHTTNRLTFDLGGREHASAALRVQDARALDLFVLVGDEPAELLERYCALTGRPRVPPSWSFGLWMGRISYDSQEQVEGVAAELRERRIPCDVLHVDTDWFAERWVCDWRFAPDRFPDPAGMLARLREQGFRVSLWQWPYVLAQASVRAEAEAAGALLHDGDGAPAVLPGEWGDAAIVDLARPAGVAWYQAQLRPLLEAGAAVVKADFGEGVPDPALHNRFPLLYNRAVFEVTEEVVGERDAMIWGRSAWAGSQRYPVHWSGDGIARFADLPCVLRSTLSFGLSGFAFYSHDIGGFSGVPTPELYVRWAQLGLFSSHARAHGTPPREPWAYGEEAEAIVRRYVELRYRLLPYLYTEAVECAARCTPLVRAMVLDFPRDRTARDLDDQYLLGRSLLVAPVLDAGEERAVWLPEGDWVDFWSGARVPGGRWVDVHAPLDVLPLWVRGGRVLPLGPVMQHVGERPLDPLEVQLCALDGRAATYVVRDDDGPRVRIAVRDGRVSADGAPGRVEVVERG
jgi:alpha-D-xyloside xylohydrolase